MTRPSVLIADDHQIVIDGLTRLLESDFEVAGTVQDGRELVTAAEKLRPAVIVADISMPMLNGIESVRQIKAAHREIKVVFLTMHPDVSYAMRAFEAGASGYVLKHSASDELVTAIREVLCGKTYVTPFIAGELMQAYKEGARRQPGTIDGLTVRQREVLQLIAEGHTAKDIAAILNISIKTVEYHKYRMMQDLGLETAAELIRYAVKHGVSSESTRRKSLQN
jgi:DNA-binding NarL/FixJ family response regulator